MRFGKLKLLKSARKQVSITVNGVTSSEVTLLLGQEGEAFFFREALDGEIADPITPMIESMERREDEE